LINKIGRTKEYEKCFPTSKKFRKHHENTKIISPVIKCDEF